MPDIGIVAPVIRWGRSFGTAAIISPDGTTGAVVSSQWWIQVAVGPRAVALSYHYPRLVEWSGKSSRIVDHLALAQTLALLLLATSILTRRRSV